MNQHIGNLIIRIVLGVTFFMHGLTKFQSGIDNIAGWFTSIGLPGGLAYGVATVELVGGLLLILGLGVRYIGLLFALVMVGAIVKVKWSAGLLGDGKNPGFELELALLAMGAYLFVAKADGFVDNFLKEKMSSMKVLKEDEMVVTFGNENNEPLLIIEEKKEALPKQRGRTGLYHYAILLPSRQDLANILRHLVEMVYPLHGGADHYFSEALYLADPDGNGIEIYHDRQKEVWRDENGELPFVSNPLAGEELLQQGSTWNGFPAGTVMGHIHFHVADLEEAKRFYVEGLGFEVTIPARNGVLFVSAGGYHHHIGLNTWQGEGILPQMPNSVGLKYFTIVLADEKQKEQVCESLKNIGKIATYKDGILQVEDPFGHCIHFKIKGEA